jgi:energy-coupling factor transport system substrate-specific component
MHFTSWTLELALLQGVFAWAYLVGFYLVRKPGSLLIVGVIEASVQVLMGSTHGTDALGWGLAQGLAAEVIMALALYRSLNPLLFLVAGAAAALLRSLWTAYIWQGWATPDLVQQYQSALPFIALAGVVVSGLVGFLGGASLARLGILPAPSPQSQ